MKINCKICCKSFETRQKNYNLCSEECRRINRIEYKKAHPPIYKNRYKPKILNCGICGEPLDKVKYGRRQYHDECIISDFIDACNEGAGSMDHRKHRFWNFGFTIDEAEEFKARFQTEEV